MLNKRGVAFVGAHARGVTPVPIPNTAVKPAGPMILRQRESRSVPAISLEPPPIGNGREGGLVCAGSGGTNRRGAEGAEGGPRRREGDAKVGWRGRGDDGTASAGKSGRGSEIGTTDAHGWTRVRSVA